MVHDLERIIIVIPYTSIITQTAETLRSIFGDDTVLEHHSAIEQKDDEAMDDMQIKARLNIENWNAPLVVTTNVQLFESIYAHKTSKCRKLHRICRSILILDEAQALPVEFLQPIVDALKTYVNLFGVSVLFSTASLPAFDQKNLHSTLHGEFKAIDSITEIIAQPQKLVDRLRRTELFFDSETSSASEIAERMMQHKRILTIVNTRKDALEIFRYLPKEEHHFHLSRMMCTKHLQDTIKKMKLVLQNDPQAIVRVVSTQLIEAGVDIDFPVVFRQEAGLDSILQAAGRCNREGKNQALCPVTVFKLENPLPRGHISQANQARLHLAADSDWFQPQTMIAYFNQLFARKTFDEKKICRLLGNPNDLNFEKAAKDFQLINDMGITVFVNFEESVQLIDHLKKTGLHKSLLKKLSAYAITLPQWSFQKLKEEHLVEEVLEGIYFIPNTSQYNPQLGLLPESQLLEELYIK